MNETKCPACRRDVIEEDHDESGRQYATVVERDESEFNEIDWPYERLGDESGDEHGDENGTFE